MGGGGEENEREGEKKGERERERGRERERERERERREGGGVFLSQHCGIFPKMHITSIQIGAILIGERRDQADRGGLGPALWPWPPGSKPSLHGC